MPNAFKGNARNSGIKTKIWLVRFLSGSQHHGKNLHSEANLGSVAKICLQFACFVDLKEACDRIPQDKLWKVLREYGVDSQLLRAGPQRENLPGGTKVDTGP